MKKIITVGPIKFSTVAIIAFYISLIFDIYTSHLRLHRLGEFNAYPTIAVYYYTFNLVLLYYFIINIIKNIKINNTNIKEI